MQEIPRVIKDLNGSDWKFQSFKDGVGYEKIFKTPNYNFSNWMNATVPGDVRLDLMQNNQIEDPFYAKTNQKSQWVNKFEWWYYKEFIIEPDEVGNKVIDLIFKGVDYFAEFWLNGTKLGNHEGMFGKISFNITKLVQKKNVLLVRLAAIKNYPNRFKVLKCQMSYGWDFAPKMITSGIWDDITLEIKDPISIDSYFIRSSLEHKELATIKLTLDMLNHSKETPVSIVTTIQGKNFESTPLRHEVEKQIAPGSSQIEIELQMKNPQLWYPWDKGTPNLYNCRIELIQEGTQKDEVQDTFGIRQFELISQNIDPEYYPWIFQINGEREFIRGGNWVPPDSLFGRINHERYIRNIQLAKKANLNLVRVWGGGLKEKEAFYKICDEEGMMVWQEFPIACTYIAPLPKDEKFLTLWKEEAESIVKSLRNHPSLLLWCGGNEFHSVSNAHIVEILAKTVKTFDDRPFIPASPEGGDNHNYEIFHGMGPYLLYLDDTFPFTSEFGLNSLPNYATLEKIIPKEELYFWSSTMNYRGQYMAITNAHKLRLQRYALPFQPSDELQSIIHASQQAQGVGLKTAIEHYRRRKLNWQHAGCAFWQIDSPWPGVSFCLIEYDFETKLSYEYVRIAFQPVLVSLKYDLKTNFNAKEKTGKLIHRQFTADVFLINDFNKQFSDCKFECVFLTQDYQVLSKIKRAIEIPANNCIQLEPLSYDFPENLLEPPRIQIKLYSLDKVISKNFYNLRYFDSMQHRRMAKFSKRMSDIFFYGKNRRIVRLAKSLYYGIRLFPILVYLLFKVRWKWKHRIKAEFEYEKLDFIR